MRGGRGPLAVDRIEVDLVDQHAHAGPLRDARERVQRVLRHERAGGVVRARQHDQPRTRGERVCDRVRVHRIAVLEAPVEAEDVGAEQAERAGQRVVRRPFEEHVVAGPDECGEREEVRARGAGRRCHPVGRRAVPLGDGLEQRRVSVRVVARQHDGVQRAGQVLEGAVQQIAAREVVRGRGPRLGPRHVRRER